MAKEPRPRGPILGLAAMSFEKPGLGAASVLRTHACYVMIGWWRCQRASHTDCSPFQVVGPSAWSQVSREPGSMGQGWESLAMAGIMWEAETRGVTVVLRREFSL